MTTTLLRSLLSPLTSLRAWRLARTSPHSFDTAWRYLRVRAHPDETPHRLHGHRPDLP
ncbi:hypothetical protein [Streptomyces albidoflavus]|uniref:hypothetical protein n=1 Tax=Streptomyces albidoflavus TaxID=1886 RepID=UPI000B2E492D|nr:hypothetical protein [Streptomyces albidoflavus]